MSKFVKKEGSLTKQGHIWKNWKERHFVLDLHLLKYYSRKEGRKQDELKGSIQISGCTVTIATPQEADGRQCCFKITPASKKIYLINASDEVTRDEWIAAVRNNAALGAGGSAAATSGGAEAAPPEEPDAKEIKNSAKGGASSSASDALVTLADFELLKVIGRGTYGKVMQVRRKDTGEVYAMKVLKKEAVFARNDPKDLQHTIAERNVLALVNTAEHPFLLGLRFAFHTPAKLYYVLNFCNGGDLYYLLSRCKKFKEGQARFYAGEIFCALQHLHGLGVIYRDLKPENVLLDSDGHVKLTDFGLSKESATADTFCGTPVYLAPEIWLRKTYGYEVDWWSLGCVLFEMVAGLPPFWGDTIKDVYKRVLHTQPKFPTMSPECQNCIERLLAREPKQRLGSHQNGADIAAHEFFAGLSWPDLLAKQIRPPFKSKSASQEDTQNFHKAFTQQKPVDSLTNTSVLTSEQEKHFEGFTYIPGQSQPSPQVDQPLQQLPSPRTLEAASAEATSKQPSTEASEDEIAAAAAKMRLSAGSSVADASSVKTVPLS